MLDEEIYGLIVALGILLAMLYAAIMFFFFLKENLKLRGYAAEDPALQAYLKREWLKLFGLGVLEIALAAALLLVKSALL